MLHRVQFLKKLFAFASTAALTASIGFFPFHECRLVTRRLLAGLAASVPVFAGVFAILQRLERSFFVSFKRKDQLRSESGL